MPTEVIMPKVDMDMASGKIMSWHIAEGEFVAKGQPLFDIETDKAAMEIEAPADGLLYHIAPEGAEIPIGTPCAWLYEEGEDVKSQPKDFALLNNDLAQSAIPQSAERIMLESVEIATNLEPRPIHKIEANVSRIIRATPLARSLADEIGTHISEISGSGPRGRVQAADVRRFRHTQIADATLSSRGLIFKPETGPLAVSRNKINVGIPFVFIHGFASDSASWAPLESYIKNRPIIRIDLPGHGKSPKLKVKSFAELVTIVRGAFDTLQLDTAHLIGHSLGAAVSLAIADTRSRKLSSLTLLSPAGLGPDINANILSGICRSKKEQSIAPWLRALVNNEDLISDNYIRQVMAKRADINLQAAQTDLAEVLFPDGVQAFDLRAALDRIDVPTKIIWGKRDQIIPWQHALKASGTTSLHLFEGVGHIPQLECIHEVSHILNNL